MIEPRSSHDRPQSVGEEIANSVSHGIGFAAAVAMLPIIIFNAMPRGAVAVVGASLFAATIPLLYLTSTLYHALTHQRAKRVFRILDHSAIYLVIAGTYSPFMLGALRGPWGWTLFGVIWGLAAGGVILKSTGGIKYERLSLALYVAMGWLIVIAAWPLYTHMSAAGLIWLGAGGIAYTVGVVFYAKDHVRYLHFVWHLCIIAGTACHVVAVMKYAG